MIEDLIKDLTIDYVKDTEIAQNIKSCITKIQKVQEAAYTLANDNSSDKLKLMRIATFLTNTVLTKLAEGKNIKSFTSKDWEEILTYVSENGILIDNEKYTLKIFSIYSDYVGTSAEVLRSLNVSKDKCDAILALSNKVSDLNNAFEQGSISESNYTEECLWILLESMLKSLSAYAEITALGKEKSDFIESLSTLALVYGRYALYSQEQAILSEYIEHQYMLNDELNTKWTAYKNSLTEEYNKFNNLLENAFSQDFDQRLKSSALIAENLGVAETEILNSTEKIDLYFTN